MIWAQVAAKPEPTANVRQVHRVGIRMYLDVGPGGEPPSDFTIGEMTPVRDDDGVPALGVAVRNTGERALDMTGSAILSDGPAGMRAGPFDVVQGTTLAPGTSGTVTVRFPRDLPNGPWQAEVRLQSGLVKKTTTSRVTFPEPGQVGSARPTDTGLDSPWLLGGMSMAAGLVILVGLAIVARRDRRRALGRALKALRPAASSRRTGSPTS